MAQGTITGSFSGGSASGRFTYVLNWSSSQSAEDIANNRSKVTLTWRITSSVSVYTYKAGAVYDESVSGYTGTISGTYPSASINFNSSQSYWTDKFVHQEVIYVQHDSDGTKNAYVTGSFNLSGTSAGTGSLSGYMQLDPIVTEGPTISSVTIVDASNAHSLIGVYASGVTKFKLSVSATPASSAVKISSYKFYEGTTLLGTISTANTSAEYTTLPVEAGEHTYKVVVTDTYNNSAEYTTQEFEVLSYSAPVLSTTTFRCNSEGVADNHGEYVSCKASWEISTIGTNSVQESKVAVLDNDYNISINDILVINSGTQSAFNVIYSVKDTLGTLESKSDFVPGNIIHFSMHPSGGISFGEESQPGKFTTTYDAEFKGGFSIASALPISSGGTGGTTAANARANLGIQSRLVTNGSIPSDYALLLVVFQDKEIWGHSYTALIPNYDATYSTSYNAWNSAYMYMAEVQFNLNNGTLSVETTKGTSTDWDAHDYNKVLITAIYGIL